MSSILSTSGINSLINSYKQSQQNNRLTPLNQRKNKYENLNSAYGTLSSKLDDFKTLLEDLADTSTSSIFNTKSASISSTEFLDVSTTSSAAASSYTMRVSQLARNDSLVSSTLTSATSSSVTSGVHNLRFRSGDYETNVEVEFDATGETNQTVMEKIRDAINKDSYAKIQTAKIDKTTAFTMDATNNSFDIDVNGTTTTVTIDSSQWADITDYDTLYDALVTNINSNVSGVTAEKIIESGTNNIRLQIKSNNTTNDITINSTGLDGNGAKVSAGNTLMDTLGIVSYKEKAAKSILSASVFSPTTSNSKLSLVAAESGYDNRLIIDSDDALTQIGLTSTILTNRYKNTDDGTTTNDTEAGFTYGTKYLDGSQVEQGTAESATNNLLNSKFEFNGLSIQRSGNVISDLVTGVTFTLKSTMAASDTTVDIDISDDHSGVKTKVKDFVKQFNDSYNFIRLNSQSSTSSGRGVFLGDATASSIKSSFSSIAYQSVSGIADGNISRLGDIGISFDPFSGLTLDESTFDTKMSDSPDQVAELFNSTNGVANLLLNQLTPVLGTDGSIASSQESFSNTITNISDRISYTQSSIDKSAEVLRKQYEALQQQLASLLMTSSYLGLYSSGQGDSSGGYF